MVFQIKFNHVKGICGTTHHRCVSDAQWKSPTHYFPLVQMIDGSHSNIVNFLWVKNWLNVRFSLRSHIQLRWNKTWVMLLSLMSIAKLLRQIAFYRRWEYTSTSTAITFNIICTKITLIQFGSLSFIITSDYLFCHHLLDCWPLRLNTAQISLIYYSLWGLSVPFIVYYTETTLDRSKFINDTHLLKSDKDQSKINWRSGLWWHLTCRKMRNGSRHLLYNRPHLVESVVY